MEINLTVYLNTKIPSICGRPKEIILKLSLQILGSIQSPEKLLIKIFLALNTGLSASVLVCQLRSRD